MCVFPTRRGGIRTAVAGRDVKKLTPLLSFIIKNIRHPAYKPVLMDVANVVIGKKCVCVIYFNLFFI